MFHLWHVWETAETKLFDDETSNTIIQLKGTYKDHQAKMSLSTLYPGFGLRITVSQASGFSEERVQILSQAECVLTALRKGLKDQERKADSGVFKIKWTWENLFCLSQCYQIIWLCTVTQQQSWLVLYQEWNGLQSELDCAVKERLFVFRGCKGRVGCEGMNPAFRPV